MIFLQLRFCHGFFLTFFFFDVPHLTHDESLSFCSIIDDMFTSLAQSFPHTYSSRFNCQRFLFNTVASLWIPSSCLLLTLPGLSDTHLISPPHFQPSQPLIKKTIMIDSLSRDNPPIHCWPHGNWTFSSAHRRKNLELFLLSIKGHKSGHTRLDHWHMSRCAQ